MKLLSTFVAAGVLLYLLSIGILFVLMYQPPARFSYVMSKIAHPLLFSVLPFEKLWLFARDGELEPGDPAPDFSLRLAKENEVLRLSSHRGKRPVVLVFGSYT